MLEAIGTIINYITIITAGDHIGLDGALQEDSTIYDTAYTIATIGTL